MPVNPPAAPSRIKGRHAIVRSLHGLLIRAVRFSQHRATSDSDRRWANATCDALADALAIARGDRRPAASDEVPRA